MENFKNNVFQTNLIWLRFVRVHYTISFKIQYFKSIKLWHMLLFTRSTQVLGKSHFERHDEKKMLFFFKDKKWLSPPWYFPLCWALGENPPWLWWQLPCYHNWIHLAAPVTSGRGKSGLLLALGLLVHASSLLSHKSHKSLQIGKDIVHFLVDWTFYFLF